MNNGLSLIYPVHNEENVIEKNLFLTLEYLKKISLPWEIIFVNNGSIDNTEKVLEKLKNNIPNISVFNLKDRGLGLAIKEGVRNSHYKYAMFYAIDLPFGLDIIGDSLDHAAQNNTDIVIGSKGHLESVNRAPFKRKISSFVYNTLLSLFFNLKIRDTQGSLFFEKEKVEGILDFCKADDAFFCTQLIIYGRLHEFNIEEIPVKYEAPRKKSKISITKDGYSLFKQIMSEFGKVQKVKSSLKDTDKFGKDYPKIADVKSEKLFVFFRGAIFFLLLINISIFYYFSHLPEKLFKRLSYNPTSNEIYAQIEKIKNHMFNWKYILAGLLLSLVVCLIILFTKWTSEVFIYNNF